MISFDTNYVIRHLVGDDSKQDDKVAKVIKKETLAGHTILITDIVLCEAIWVLESIYEAKRSDILKTLKSLWEETLFIFESPSRISASIDRLEIGKADFSDYLIDETSKEFDRELKTFDKKLF